MQFFDGMIDVSQMQSALHTLCIDRANYQVCVKSMPSASTMTSTTKVLPRQTLSRAT
jgi:hypothetical protein